MSMRFMVRFEPLPGATKPLESRRIAPALRTVCLETPQEPIEFPSSAAQTTHE